MCDRYSIYFCAAKLTLSKGKRKEESGKLKEKLFVTFYGYDIMLTITH
jgi:hypothetical protein